MDWDVSSFGNDGALEWLQELASSRTSDPVKNAIEVVEGSGGFVDALDAERAVAAAEVIAASRGYPHPDLPQEAALWIKAQKYKAPDGLARKARAVVARIAINSELRDLWDGTNAGPGWMAVMKDLQNRLGMAVPEEEKPAAGMTGDALDLESIFNQAVELVAQGYHESAIEKYDQALEIDSGFVVGYIGRGTSYLALGKFDEALDDLNKAIDLEPEVAEAYYLRAQAYFQTGKTGRAIVDLTVLINMDGRRAEAYLMRGLANAEMNRYAKAVEDFTKAIEHDAEQASAFLHRSKAYERIGRFDLAGKDMKEYERMTGTMRSL